MNSKIPLKTLLTFIFIINIRIGNTQLEKRGVPTQTKSEFLTSKAQKQLGKIQFLIDKHCNRKARQAADLFTKESFMDRRLGEEEPKEQSTVNSVVLAECKKAMSSFNSAYCFSTGLTYKKMEHEKEQNIDYWGCPDCGNEEETGKTKCFSDLPLLCHYHGKYSRAKYEVLNPNVNYGWSEGMVKKGPSFMGCVISSKNIGDLVCQETFGTGWRMATSDQGMIIKGMMGYDYVGPKWKSNGPKESVPYMFWAHGNVDDEEKDFWIYNQSGNNCFKTTEQAYWK